MLNPHVASRAFVFGANTRAFAFENTDYHAPWQKECELNCLVATKIFSFRPMYFKWILHTLFLMLGAHLSLELLIDI
jgi:hypothetical protein